ncbi:MAG: hypothetical protein CM1200mP36_11270 [Gammaproteobacteria bacterium]|nr:MAG: hypothetical protein CM1200mP36_11270 [Gammaproteobacteria bacterium]
MVRRIHPSLVLVRRLSTRFSVRPAIPMTCRRPVVVAVAGAAALACGMVPLADGTDLGGSLRNPASFCNIVGFRPSPGRVPKLAANAWSMLSVHGPMARTVSDLAFLLSVMAGPDRRDPISLGEPGSTFLRSLDRTFRGTRIAWSENLGRYPVDPP